jgi:hypothetical protein
LAPLPAASFGVRAIERAPFAAVELLERRVNQRQQGLTVRKILLQGLRHDFRFGTVTTCGHLLSGEGSELRWNRHNSTVSYAHLDDKNPLQSGTAPRLFPTFDQNRKGLGFGTHGRGAISQRSVFPPTVSLDPTCAWCDCAGVEEASHDTCLDGEINILRYVARDARNLKRVELADDDADDAALKI